MDHTLTCFQVQYEVTFTVKAGEHNDTSICKCDISDNYGGSILSQKEILGSELQPNEWTNFTLTFTSTTLMTSAEFRVSSYGTADVYVDRVIIQGI